LSRQHQQARDKLTSIELAEQVTFEQFSSILRHSQAEERIQASRMRQWTVGFSLAAGLIGFSATWIRFRQLDKQNASSLRLTSATDLLRFVYTTSAGCTPWKYYDVQYSPSILTTST
ncbi:unnamed protein product, partial [Schistosoma mattheei]